MHATKSMLVRRKTGTVTVVVGISQAMPLAAMVVESARNEKTEA